MRFINNAIQKNRSGFIALLAIILMISPEGYAQTQMSSVKNSRDNNQHYQMNPAYQGPWIGFTFFKGRNNDNGLGLSRFWHEGMTSENPEDMDRVLNSLQTAIEYYYDEGRGAKVFFFHLPAGAIDPSQMGINQYLSMPEEFRNKMGRRLANIRTEHPDIKIVIYAGFCHNTALSSATCNYDMTSQEMLEVLNRRGEFPFEKRIEPQWDNQEHKLFVKTYFRALAEDWKPDALFLDHFTNNEEHENWEYDGIWLTDIKREMEDAGEYQVDYIGVEPIPLIKIGEGQNKEYFLDEEKMAKAPSFSTKKYFETREPEDGFNLDPHTQLNTFLITASLHDGSEDDFIYNMNKGICERGLYPIIAVGFQRMEGNYQTRPIIERAKMGISLSQTLLRQCHGIGGQ